MKRLRIVVFLVLVLISTTLSYLALSENGLLLDFADIKNAVERQELKNEITRTHDIDSLRKKSLILADLLENRNWEKHQVVIKVHELLIGIFLIGIISAVLLTIEFSKRRKLIE